jgi:hypothetical protein
MEAHTMAMEKDSSTTERPLSHLEQLCLLKRLAECHEVLDAALLVVRAAVKQTGDYASWDPVQGALTVAFLQVNVARTAVPVQIKEC